MADVCAGRPATVRVVHGPVYGYANSAANSSPAWAMQPQAQWPANLAHPGVQCRTPAAHTTMPKAMPGGTQLPCASKRVFTNAKSLMMSYNFKGDFQINGRPLILAVDPVNSQRSHVATGLRAWDGGIVLAKYLEKCVQKVQPAPRRRRALELGCGTGVAGLSFAVLGNEVLLTDIGDTQALLTQGNIMQNQGSIAAAGGAASYGSLDWRRLPERGQYGYFDLVFAGDVIWHETLVEPFLQAVAWATSGPGAGEVILSHKVRDQESLVLFRQMLAPLGLEIVKEVLAEQALGPDGHPDVRVYHLKRVR